jgi:hypothetical protein
VTVTWTPVGFWCQVTVNHVAYLSANKSSMKTVLDLLYFRQRRVPAKLSVHFKLHGCQLQSTVAGRLKARRKVSTGKCLDADVYLGAALNLRP